MCVAMKDGVDRIADQRLFEPAGAEEGKDLRRLALHRCLDRRIVQHCDALIGAQLGQRGFEFERFVDGFVDELLDRIFTPGSERAASISAGKTFYAGKADAMDFACLAIEHAHSRTGKNAHDLIRFSRFVIMVAEHRNDRNPRCGQAVDQHMRLFRQAVISQIAAQDQHICVLRRMLKERAQVASRVFRAMQIANRRQPNFFLGNHSALLDVSLMFHPSKGHSQSACKTCTGHRTVTMWHAICCIDMTSHHFVPGNNCDSDCSFWTLDMRNSTLTAQADDDGQGTAAFYRHVLDTLNASPCPFLVGGAYAFNHYTGISRHTKDLDVFIRQQDYACVSDALRQIGYETELTFPHWLAKARLGEDYIDLIFSSGNGVASVDDDWFDHASETEILGVQVKICPIEEMIWSKSFIMERERFDGADIAHLLRARGDQLDWQRMLRRFGQHWRVLLSHCILFGFAYPDHRELVPVWVMDELIERLRHETHSPPDSQKVCQGTLLSREQYLADVEQWGYRDARLVPLGNMTARDTAHWTEAIKDKH